MSAFCNVRPFVGHIAWIRFGIAIVITWCIMACSVMDSQFCANAQNPVGGDSVDASSLSIVALEQIQQDYFDFLAERKRLHDGYSQTLVTLTNTQEDLQRIGNDGLRQQLMAMQSSMASMRIGAVLREKGEDFEEEDGLIRSKMIADLNTAMRGEELRQLDAATQAIVRRRMECLQKGFQLQQQWLKWQQEWPSFLTRYWPHSDPERRFTKLEIETRLAILKNSDPEDYAAAITAALLMDRLGEYDDAIAMIDKVLQAQTTIQTTAMIAKASLLFSKNDQRAANATLVTAIKSKNETALDRWFRARIAASQKQFATAEKTWAALVNVKSLELESRRGLALLYCERAERLPAMGKRAVKEAKLAFDLEPQPDWFAHFVLSLALHSNGETAEAILQLEKATYKATDENRILCENLRESIQAGKNFAWDFRNTIP